VAYLLWYFSITINIKSALCNINKSHLQLKMVVLLVSISSATLYLPFTLGLPFNAFIMLILMICWFHATYLSAISMQIVTILQTGPVRREKNNEGASRRSMQMSSSRACVAACLINARMKIMLGCW
jgi:hypothetical protein